MFFFFFFFLISCLIFLFFRGFLWAYREKQTLKSASAVIAARAPESMVAVGVIYLPYVPSSSLGHLEPCCV